MPGKTNWKIRRTLMFLITAFCMAVIWRAMGLPETENAVMAVRYSFWVIMAVMAIYVFGVITDDHIENYFRHKYGAVDAVKHNTTN